MNVTNSDFKKINSNVSSTNANTKKHQDYNGKSSSNSYKNYNTNNLIISNKSLVPGIGKSESFSKGLSMPIIEPHQSKNSNILSREDLNAMLFKVKI